MNNKPLAITREEFNEIASSQELQDMWGMENTTSMKEMLASIYVAKFQFVSGSPGYCGDLFIIQADYLDTELPTTRLFRDQANQLTILR